MTDDRVLIRASHEGSIAEHEQLHAAAIDDLRTAKVFFLAMVDEDGSVVLRGSSHPDKTTAVDLLNIAEETSQFGPTFCSGCVRIAALQAAHQLQQLMDEEDE